MKKKRTQQKYQHNRITAFDRQQEMSEEEGDEHFNRLFLFPENYICKEINLAIKSRMKLLKKGINPHSSEYFRKPYF